MILRINAVFTNDPTCKQCGGHDWFWHCKVGVGLATCLGCKVLTSIKDGKDTNRPE